MAGSALKRLMTEYKGKLDCFKLKNDYCILELTLNSPEGILAGN